MKKKILGIGLACLTAGTLLAGCGASNTQPTETTIAEATTTSTTTAAETTTTTVETTTTTQETSTTTEAPTTTETTTASSSDDSYDEILNAYKGIVKDGHDNYVANFHNIQDAHLPDYIDVASIYDNFPVSYSLVDIDGNGVSELLIWGSYGLQAAYTTVDKEIKPLCFSSYRAADIAVGDDFVFYVRSSYSGFEGAFSIFKMSDDGKSLVITDMYEYGYREEPNTFIKYENLSGDFFNQSEKQPSSSIPISEEELNAVINAHKSAFYSGERHNF